MERLRRGALSVSCDSCRDTGGVVAKAYNWLAPAPGGAWRNGVIKAASEGAIPIKFDCAFYQIRY